MEGSKSARLFLNGKIYQKFKPLSVCEAIVVRNSRILFSGPSDVVLRKYANEAESIVDLHGKSVMPGFIDAHIHLDDVGKSLNSLNLRGIESISKLKSKVAEYRINNPEAKVIIGMGWDQEIFSEGRYPNSSDIDSVVKDIPVFLERYCEHVGVVNSALLNLYSNNQFQDSFLPVNKDGNPTGLVKEEANDFFRLAAFELMGKGEAVLVDAAKHIVALGVTTIGFVSCSRRSLQFLDQNKEHIGLRVRAYLTTENREELIQLKNSVAPNAFLKVNGMKLFMDGALGGGTAYLREHYTDDPENNGFLLLERSNLTHIVEEFRNQGIQLAIHAIGDAAIDEIIRTFEPFGKEEASKHRIEHLSVLRDDQLSKLRDIGIGVAVQPEFTIDDWWVVKRLGRDRCRHTFPLGSLLSFGIRVGLSTDSPVEPVNPWLTVDAAVNRGKGENLEISPISIEEKVDLATALSAYTQGSAELVMEGETLGSLEEGKRADFIVLDKDPFSASDVRSIKVLETYIGGDFMYSRE